MNILPSVNIDNILTFLDGESLLSCSCISTEFYRLTDKQSLWKRVSKKLDATENDINYIYQNNWKHLFCNHNNQSNSKIFKWEIHNFSSLTRRIYSNNFQVGDFIFRLIMDPLGNPGVFLLEKGISLYLECKPIKNLQEYECCCEFSLRCISSKRFSSWYSSLEDNRFNQEISSWGVHTLIESSKIYDKTKGFLIDDCLTVQTNIVLLYLKIKVFYQQPFKNYQGFGINDIGDVPLSYELFDSTLFTSFKSMLLKDLKLSNVNQFRLWIYTNDEKSRNMNGLILSPKILIDENNSNATLYKLLSSYCNRWREVKLWVESSKDGAYYENIFSQNNKMGCVNRTFIKSNLNKTLPSIKKSNILIFIKYFIKNHLYTTYIIINPLSSLQILFSIMSKITGYKENDLKAMIEITPYLWNSLDINDNYKKNIFISCSNHNNNNNNDSIESFNIVNGSILHFYLHRNEEKIKKKYDKWTTQVIQNILDMKYSGQLQPLQLSNVVQAYEKCGFEEFRVLNIIDKHESVKKLLSYISSERHIEIWCDICGCKEFKGIRYKCMECDDYDVCESCQNKTYPINLSYKYNIKNNKGIKIKSSKHHCKEHQMIKIKPIEAFL